MSTKPAAIPSVSPDDYFSVVDEVLVSLGRSNLSSSPSSRKIIEVLPTDRALQVLAGPGSGKTEAIVWRVLYELFVLGRPAGRLLVTTFTNRAATELQVRVVERSDEFIRIAKRRGIPVFDPQVHNLRIGTIHSLCDELLAEFDLSYVEAGTQVIDDAETSMRLARVYPFLGFSKPPAGPKVINRLLAQQGLVELFRPRWEDKWPQRVMQRVDFLKGCLATHAETWIPRCANTNTVNGIELTQSASGLTSDLCELQTKWEAYQDQQSVLDFTTIQKRFHDRQSTLLDKFDHVFVDEFQDSNPIQFDIHTTWLQDTNTRLTVVGDDDQAIYRFRGSDVQCFHGLEPHCSTKAIPFRRETLAVNFRSSKSIVSFSESFKSRTVLHQLSMPKSVSAGPKAPVGNPVRLLTGPWDKLCAIVAEEIDSLGAGRPQTGDTPVPSVAVLSFSTSEKESRERKSPALVLRKAIENKVRIYNPRNKTAATKDSPVAMLLGLISYLIDPVSRAPIGKKGGPIEVWASCNDPSKSAYALSEPPTFFINDSHALLQKTFRKGGGTLANPDSARAEVLSFVDDIRSLLVQLPQGSKARMALSGFVARMLSFPMFRGSGFTLALFRQALFTQLLEANTAPTRLSNDPLDQPLEVTLKNGKYVWPQRYWSLLHIFGGYLQNGNLDDLAVEAFEEDAVLMITFHQAKGLEFDHAYVAATGRTPDVAPALRTGLFSGSPIPYSTVQGLQTTDSQTLMLALADREREVYVALTRPRHALTILHDPSLGIDYFTLNPAIEQLFASRPVRLHPKDASVEVREIHA